MDAIGPGALVQDRYELDEHLGKGGMAEVWRARDRRLGRTVAIKLLAPSLSDEAEFLVRFFSEAQAVARIAHPHVVRVLDFGEADGRQFLVMEYVPGGSVRDLTGRPLLPERAAEIVTQAARGAGAAHELGIVHRDIKPANILLTNDGYAKLADFGIAATAGREPLTVTGAAIGSPHYISPEQASGREAIPASDVYSLGAVLYELLTGNVPFPGNNATAIAIAHVEDHPKPPGMHVPDLDPALGSLVMQCLEKDPDLRFRSGDALASALEMSGPSSAPSARPTVTEPSLLPRGRTRMMVAAVTASFALLFALAFYVGARPEPPPQDLADFGNGGPPAGGGPTSPSPEDTLGALAADASPSPSPTSSPTPTPTETASRPETKKTSEGPPEEKGTESTPEPSPSPSPSPSPAATVAPSSTPTAEAPNEEGTEP